MDRRIRTRLLWTRPLACSKQRQLLLATHSKCLCNSFNISTAVSCVACNIVHCCVLSLWIQYQINIECETTFTHHEYKHSWKLSIKLHNANRCSGWSPKLQYRVNPDFVPINTVSVPVFFPPLITRTSDTHYLGLKRHKTYKICLNCKQEISDSVSASIKQKQAIN